jgi:hypothetical protein
MIGFEFELAGIEIQMCDDCKTKSYDDKEDFHYTVLGQCIESDEELEGYFLNLNSFVVWEEVEETVYMKGPGEISLTQDTNKRPELVLGPYYVNKTDEIYKDIKIASKIIKYIYDCHSGSIKNDCQYFGCRISDIKKHLIDSENCDEEDIKIGCDYEKNSFENVFIGREELYVEVLTGKKRILYWRHKRQLPGL